jgi:hypothetical protein
MHFCLPSSYLSLIIVGSYHGEEVIIASSDCTSNLCGSSFKDQGGSYAQRTYMWWTLRDSIKSLVDNIYRVRRGWENRR